MKRKGLSIFLAVCLVFSMMTFAASAADDGGKVKRESISVEDTGASFRVVKGGRLEISSESAAEDGSYSWEAVKNDGIVKVVASEGKKPLILEAQQEGKATFKLVAGEDEAQFDVVVITDQKGVVIDPAEVEVTVGDTVSLKAVFNNGTAEETAAVFAWGSKDPSVAKVDKNTGKVTGVKKGTTQITAQTTVDGENYMDICTVTVVDPLKIEYAEDANGKVTGPKEAARKSIVTVAAEPNKDYKVTAIKVATKDDGAVVVNKPVSGDGKQTLQFEMPEKDVVVSAVFETAVVPPVAKYKVTVNPVKNGKVAVDKETADKGETVKITLTPDAGYEMGDLKVVDKDDKLVKLTSAGDNAFTFTMPDSDVVVAAAFAKKNSDPDPQQKFSDVPAGSWYEDAVYYVTGKGYFSGIGNNKFDPKGNVTRGQLCTILYAMEGKPTVTSGNVFSDVAPSKYYYDPVRWAAANGMVAGYTDKTFKPNVYVSRQQLASVLYKYTVYKKFDVSVSANITTFADYSSITNYAVTPLRWAVSHKVMSGTNRNTLNPLGAATRAEFAVMLKAYDANVRK